VSTEKKNIEINFDVSDHSLDQWCQVLSKLPENFNPHYIRFARQYFRVQLRIEQGNAIKARRMMKGLQNKEGYLEFEDANQSLLAAIDLAVRGKTNWDDKPLFRINK